MFTEWRELPSNAISSFPFSYQTFKDIQHLGCLPAYNLYRLFYEYSIRGEQAATVMKHLPGIARNGAQFTGSIKS